jgi:hypothetical protein
MPQLLQPQALEIFVENLSIDAEDDEKIDSIEKGSLRLRASMVKNPPHQVRTNTQTYRETYRETSSSPTHADAQTYRETGLIHKHIVKHIVKQFGTNISCCS